MSWGGAPGSSRGLPSRGGGAVLRPYSAPSTQIRAALNAESSGGCSWVEDLFWKDKAEPRAGRPGWSRAPPPTPSRARPLQPPPWAQHAQGSRLFPDNPCASAPGSSLLIAPGTAPTGGAATTQSLRMSSLRHAGHDSAYTPPPTGNRLGGRPPASRLPPPTPPSTMLPSRSLRSGGRPPSSGSPRPPSTSGSGLLATAWNANRLASSPRPPSAYSRPRTSHQGAAIEPMALAVGGQMGACASRAASRGGGRLERGASEWAADASWGSNIDLMGAAILE